MNPLVIAMIVTALIGGTSGMYFTMTDSTMDTFRATSETNEIQNRDELLEAYFTVEGGVEVTNIGSQQVKTAKIEITNKDNDVVYSKIYGVNPSEEWTGIKTDNNQISIATKEKIMLLAANTMTADIGMKGYVITDNGNSFAIKNDHVTMAKYEKVLKDKSISNGTGDGQAMVDGMGLQTRIIQMENNGKITHGNGIVGTDESIRPYLQVQSNTNFASTVLETDTKETHYIPEFWKSYDYTGSSLNDNTPTVPNILGYSTSKSMSGSPSIGINPDGILASGTGTIVVKLVDTSPNSIIRGTLDNADVKFVSSPLDLTTLSMSGSNYVIYQSTYPTKSGSNIYSNPNVLVASDSDLSASYSYSVNCQSFGKRGSSGSSCHGVNGATPHYGCYYSNCNYYHSHGTSGSLTTSISSSTGPTGIYISQLSSTTSGSPLQYEYPLRILTPDASSPYSISGGVSQSLYSTAPWNEQFHFTENFEQPATIPTNSYLVITLGGGSALVKAESGSNNQEFINIDNLSPNTPYEITKDGTAIATGMTSASGQIAFDVTGDIPSLTGGFLELFPDSLAYRGSFSTVVFDNFNGETIHIDTEEDKTYVVHAYANIPVTGTVNVTNTNLVGTLPTTTLSYLDGNYVNGDAIKVPVIPGFKTINLTINGVSTSLDYANILGGTGIKIADPTSGTVTNQDLANSIHRISAQAGTPTYVIATSDGTISAIMSVTISGTASLSNSYVLSQIPPPPPPPVRKDPLEGFVEIYNNGVLVKTQTLGINPNPGFTPANTLSGNIASQSVTYTYGDYNLSGSTSVDVNTGDFVEFYLYGKITGDIENYSPPSAMRIDSERGTATATVNIRDAHIQTSQ